MRKGKTNSVYFNEKTFKFLTGTKPSPCDYQPDILLRRTHTESRLLNLVVVNGVTYTVRLVHWWPNCQRAIESNGETV